MGPTFLCSPFFKKKVRIMKIKFYTTIKFMFDAATFPYKKSVKKGLSSIPHKIKSYGRWPEKKFPVEGGISYEISFP